MKRIIPVFVLTAFFGFSLQAQNEKLKSQIDKKADELETKVIEWRRDIHQNPELSNREFKTSAKVVEHLKSLGIEVQSEVAHTGVVGILKGGRPGPVVALRADMDGLPVIERADIPFASRVKSTYNGQEVGVMHACGHDTHVAILMGVAEILAGMKNEIPGTVKFIFQPAEEGAPLGEEGGAELMVKEGVLKNPDVQAIFGLHISSGSEINTISYKPGASQASANSYSIVVKGKQTHGASPWTGVDPIVVSAQIINSIQTIVSRKTNLIRQPAVVTVGSIHGGVRNNIIPEEVKMEGTIRALDNEMRDQIFEDLKTMATKVAESQGATAVVTINHGVPITYNDPSLTGKMLPTLLQAAGKENVHLRPAIMGAEDFSYFQEQIPGFYFGLGGMTPGNATPFPHHTPDFFVDEGGMKLGVRALSYLVFDYLSSTKIDEKK
ncbi:MAG TPA: amidohydrolase [Cyclobacteriaceae bacterium]|jgi:amidohydrolase